MRIKRAFSGARRVALDFLLGFGLFSIIAALACDGDVSRLSAHASLMAWPPEFAAFELPLPPELQRAKPEEHLPVLITLGLAFASALALNLWFARHVRRVHVAARGRGQAR